MSNFQSCSTMTDCYNLQLQRICAMLRMNSKSKDCSFTLYKYMTLLVEAEEEPIPVSYTTGNLRRPLCSRENDRNDIE
jgi:hypothetical protein